MLLLLLLLHSNLGINLFIEHQSVQGQPHLYHHPRRRTTEIQIGKDSRRKTYLFFLGLLVLASLSLCSLKQQVSNVPLVPFAAGLLWAACKATGESAWTFSRLAATQRDHRTERGNHVKDGLLLIDVIGSGAWECASRQEILGG